MVGVGSVAGYLFEHAGAAETAFFAAVVTAIWLTEKIVLAQPTAEKLRHAALNAALLALVAPVQFAMTLAYLALAQWTTRHHCGLVYLLPGWRNPWIKYGLMFIVLDFLDYVYHFIAHRVPMLWRFHLVHHTDRAVDVSTTFREHPGETLIRVCFLSAWVVLCGASVEALILRQTFETIANVSQHTVFRLPPSAARRLGWLFVTPNLHHAHHHFEMPGTNCNYGDVFSIWDRLFGTYVDLSDEEPVFGLDTHMEDDHRLLRLLGIDKLFASLRRASEDAPS